MRAKSVSSFSDSSWLVAQAGYTVIISATLRTTNMMHAGVCSCDRHHHTNLEPILPKCHESNRSQALKNNVEVTSVGILRLQVRLTRFSHFVLCVATCFIIWTTDSTVNRSLSFSATPTLYCGQCARNARFCRFVSSFPIESTADWITGKFKVPRTGIDQEVLCLLAAPCTRNMDDAKEI